MTAARLGSGPGAGLRRSIADAIRLHPWITVWLSLIPFVLVRSGTLAEADTFWQTRTGLLTLSSGTIPRTDSFSWTAHGAAWTQNSWGFDVVLAIFYRAAGLAGVALTGAAFVAAVFAIALVLARKAGAHPVVTAAVVQASCAPLTPFFSARPQLVDYVAILLTILVLDRMLEATGPPVLELVAIGVGTLVWVNLHAAAPLGVAVIGGATALVALTGKARRRAGWFALASLIAAACTLVNPYGFDVFTQSLKVADASNELITEWQPLDPTNVVQMLAFVPGVIALVVALRRRDPVIVAALGITTIGSVGAIRFLPLLLLVALPVLASAATSPAVLRYIDSRRLMLTQAAVVGAGVMTFAAGIALTHVGRPEPAFYPPAMVAAIPRDCKVFNSVDIGGYVILKRPDVFVSIDSRNDMYGVDRARRIYRPLFESSDKLPARAGCVLIPSSTPLARSLRHDTAWTLVISDGTWVLYARR